MAEEKILDNEILDDETLEGVAGGSNTENRNDRDLLKKMGYYDSSDKSIVVNLKKSFSDLSNELGCALNIKVNSNTGRTANKYFIADQEVSRKEFWTIINRLNDTK